MSVREEDGQKIIRELTGRNAEILLDPTMLLPQNQWNALSKKPHKELPEHYVVCYFLGMIDKKYNKIIQDFAKKVKLPIIMLFDISYPDYYVFDPNEVLYCIKNAEYVLTDSFHGSVFSILFKKNFYVFGRNEGKINMSSRLNTLLNTFDLNERQYTGEWKIYQIINGKRLK